MRIEESVSFIFEGYRFFVMATRKMHASRLCYDEEKKEYANFKLKELEIVSILEEKIKGKDKKYIENMRKNFDPFLGNGNIVKVRLTEEGESLLKSLTNYRPKLVKFKGTYSEM